MEVNRHFALLILLVRRARRGETGCKHKWMIYNKLCPHKDMGCLSFKDLPNPRPKSGHSYTCHEAQSRKSLVWLSPYPPWPQNITALVTGRAAMTPCSIKAKRFDRTQSQPTRCLSWNIEMGLSLKSCSYRHVMLRISGQWSSLLASRSVSLQLMKQYI